MSRRRPAPWMVEEKVTVVDGLKYVGRVPTDADILRVLGYIPRKPGEYIEDEESGERLRPW